MDKIFNNPELYPTPEETIFEMLQGYSIENKIILEPSAGKGNIIDYLNLNGAKEVLFCENNDDLATISGNKAKFITSDFLTLESSQISHINFIIGNPPFSNADKHILHAYDIAPAGCKIIMLCNANTIENSYSQSRKELKAIIQNFGSFRNLGSTFEDSEHETSVKIGLIELSKPGAEYSTEFNGFYLDEKEEPEGDGIMSYNVVRDLVNRYIESIKIFDRQLEEAQKMNQLTAGYYSVKMGFSVTENNKPIQRNEFKKEMQKSGWQFIFAKMNMQKHTTKGLREDINKFVEQQSEIPFTMRNIYKMLQLVVGTTSQRMNKAILEVFDKVTYHHFDNRYNIEGWKTNEHYLLGKKFIFPYMIDTDSWSWNKYNARLRSSGNSEIIEDLIKALCYLTGDNYDKFDSLRSFLSSDNLPYGEWKEWGYFKIKGFKKGTMHFEFLDTKLWEAFNQRVAMLKGYPLYESAPDKRTARQKAKDEAQPRPTADKTPKPRYEAETKENFQLQLI